MDRFSQLEFEEQQPRHNAQGTHQVRDARYFYQEATRFWLAGDFEIALRNYSRCLEQNSSIFNGWSGQVRMLLEMDETKEADLWADKAMDLFPDHPELLALKAVAHKRQGKMKQAIDYSDNALTKADITSRVWLARAEVFLERKSAVVDGCISKAITLATEEKSIIKLEAGRLLRRKRSFAQAIGILEDALTQLTQSALTWYELGCCQQQLGLSQAHHSLQEALRLHPHWPAAQQALTQGGRRGLWRRLFGR